MSDDGARRDPSAAEMQAVDRALDRLAEGRAHRPTLWGLVQGWQQVVEAVEDEYDWSVYEYFNDLHVRRDLQIVIDDTPMLAWLRQEIAALDARFEAATRSRGSAELLDRVPRFPGPELARDLDDPGATTTLYRPVGDNELARIRESGFARFPPRLPEQPIFYPVLSRAYAEKIARDWNARDGRRGHVTRFAVQTHYVAQYRAHAVGGDQLRELWVPAQDLEDFCRHIVGTIDVIATFPTDHDCSS